MEIAKSFFLYKNISHITKPSFLIHEKETQSLPFFGNDNDYFNLIFVLLHCNLKMCGHVVQYIKISDLWPFSSGG